MLEFQGIELSRDWETALFCPVENCRYSVVASLPLIAQRLRYDHVIDSHSADSRRTASSWAAHLAEVGDGTE